MADPRRLVIVGGGITGLAAAHAATGRARELGRPLAVTLLESSGRLGGNLLTERVDGFVLDAGPDSWVATKPHAAALARELGLGDAIIGTNEGTRRYYVAWAGRLHEVPEGLVLGVPTKLGPLARTGLFSLAGKARMALEPTVKARRFEGDEDESIADFATRRLGREASDRLVAPLLGGISAGDASEISVRASFPQLVAMEREHGSLVRGMRAATRARAEAQAAQAAKAAASGGQGGGASGGPAAGSGFLSLAGGVGDLVRALRDRLEADAVTLRTGATVRALGRRGPGWSLETEAGDRLDADAVLLAVPATAAQRLTGSLDEGIGRALGSIRYSATATVFLAFRREDVKHPLDGVGFVVPRSLGRPILAGTWVSSKWRGRAPEGHVLLRAFFGGAAGGEALALDDGALADLARGELAALMGLDATPLWSRVFRFAGSAQMRVGHLAAMRGLRERLAEVAPGLVLGGGGYDGVGIPDCIRQGQEAGRALADGTR
jgi:oxygen-dependent protoporphyrinogen oxidase